jgi:hypothetical protein
MNSVDIGGDATATTRRSVLLASLMLLAASCSRRAALPVSDAADEPTPDPLFLSISRIITGHGDLNPITGARLSKAFADLAPDVHAKILRLPRIWNAGMSPDAALAAARAVGLEPVALAVVAAWYTGTAGTGPKAVTVSYRDALMQRPVADGLYSPTYALGGPAWWTAEPPEVRVVPSTTQTAPAPPTVGTPETRKP